MSKQPYWVRRMAMIEEAAHNKGEAYFAALEKEYRDASAAVEKEIAKWYQRFADNNQISMTEAKRLLNTRELAEFRWSLDEYIRHGMENAIDQRWMKELENASARVHVSRLYALQVEMQQQVEVLFGGQADGLDQLGRGIFTDAYYHTAFEIQKGLGVGWDIVGVNSKQLDKVLQSPWTLDGKTFSDRIWSNKRQLVGSLQSHLSQALLRGDPPRKTIKEIAEQFDVSRRQAGRLVMTESAFFASHAQRDAYKMLGVDKYEIVATLDTKTSEICQELDGKVCDVADFQPGVTAQPFHPNCRTATAPWFEDSAGGRAARGPDGKTYFVPAGMKYADWKKTFVDGGAKSGLVKAADK